VGVADQRGVYNYLVRSSMPCDFDIFATLPVCFPHTCLDMAHC
jgi:hypothetical protein